MKVLIALLLSLTIILPQPTFAWTGTWSTIKQITSGGSSDRMIVKLVDLQDDNSHDGCGTDDYSVILVSTDPNYDEDIKMAMAAYLAGKEVLFDLSGCDNGYMKVNWMRVCVDSSSCGQ